MQVTIGKYVVSLYPAPSLASIVEIRPKDECERGYVEPYDCQTVSGEVYTPDPSVFPAVESFSRNVSLTGSFGHDFGIPASGLNLATVLADTFSFPGASQVVPNITTAKTLSFISISGQLTRMPSGYEYYQRVSILALDSSNDDPWILVGNLTGNRQLPYIWETFGARLEDGLGLRG